MKQIEKYLLPRVTEDLLHLEAQSSIHLTKEVADKINELVDAYNHLIETRYDKMNEQDARIREGILYMKDNLAYSLKELMDLILKNGYVDNRIKEHIELLIERVDNLIGSIDKGSVTSMDAEVIDIRVNNKGESFRSAGESVRKLGDLIDDTRNELFSRVIPLNVKFQYNGYIHIDNYVVNDVNSKRTGLIYSQDFDYLEVNTIMGSGGYAIAFYDKNRTLLKDKSIEGVGGGLKQYKFNLKELNASYIQVSCYGEDNIKNATCLLYTNDSIVEKIELNKRMVFSNRVNLTLDGYIHPDGYMATGEAKRTGLIDCRGYKYVEYESNLSNLGNELTLYDETGKYIKEYSVVGVSKYRKNIVDLTGTGACYVEVSCYGKDNYNTAYCLLYNDTNLDINKVPTKDMKMLIFGDSIAETSTMNDDGSNYKEGTNTNWVTYSVDTLKVNFKNYACYGAHYGDFTTNIFRQKLSNQLSLAMNDPSNDDVNIIVLSLGTNDVNQTEVDDFETAISVGSISGLDRTKLYQAIRYAMESLRVKYPNAKCFVGTPIQRGDGLSTLTVRKAIIEMAERYNFIVIDAYKESGIIKELSSTYLTDGLHPNKSGKLRLSELYTNTIINHFIGR